MLDPWPFGGGLSLMQALSLGVPVVTQTGSSLKNRLGTALCQQIQWTEGLVTNQEDYISAALKLAKQGRAEDISARYAKNISQEQAGRDLSELLSQAHHYQA